ncbi:MAG: hypothetical protein K2X07_12295 [Caulobacteraceae bacterium]|nr:hypothetical protein [Caulobacteraceae bacterium]
MRRIVFGALAGTAVLAAAGAASAQYVTYGQPSYGAQAHVTYGQPTVQDYRYAHGGQTAVVESRPGAYAATGAWADGRSGYGYGYGSGGVGYGGCHDRCGGHYAPPPPSYGCSSPCGGYGQGYAHAGGYAYSQTTHWSERRGHWSRYRAYGRHDRGGRYGYSVGHDRRGYYERDGYHDDRPPAGHDRRRRGHDRDCDCYTILDDR